MTNNRTKDLDLTLIDSDHYGEHGIETMVFPGGEPHVKVPKFSGPVQLVLRLRSWMDVGLGALTLDAICRQGISPAAFIPYFPGARQDRSDGKSPLTAALFSRLFHVHHDRLSIFDPHSDLAAAHIGAEHAYMPTDLPMEVKPDVVGIIAPDEGATWRAGQFRDRFYPAARLIVCKKKRDFESGRFIGFEMPKLPGSGRYIIVDDICDGGGTFNLLANQFLSDPLASGSSLELFVSHGIFSKGLDAISPAIEHITTTDSWCQIPHGDRLTVIPLIPNLQGELRARFHNAD